MISIGSLVWVVLGLAVVGIGLLVAAKLRRAGATAESARQRAEEMKNDEAGNVARAGVDKLGPAGVDERLRPWTRGG